MGSPEDAARCSLSRRGDRKQEWVEQGTGREHTCVRACNSYLQFKCLPGPSLLIECVDFFCECVRGIPSGVDGALPNGRPVLNIKAQTGRSVSTVICPSMQETLTGCCTFWMHTDTKRRLICAEKTLFGVLHIRNMTNFPKIFLSSLKPLCERSDTSTRGCWGWENLSSGLIFHFSPHIRLFPPSLIKGLQWKPSPWGLHQKVIFALYEFSVGSSETLETSRGHLFCSVAAGQHSPPPLLCLLKKPNVRLSQEAGQNTDNG